MKPRSATILNILLFSVLFAGFVQESYAQETVVEGEELDNVTITEDEARRIMKGLFDLPRLTHSLAIGKIARDERLAAYADGFMQRNYIEVLTIGYIDSEEFWPKVFRDQRLAKITKSDNDNLLAAKIIFLPLETDGAITGYNCTLELTGKTSQVYELLAVSKDDIDLIATETSQQQLGSTTYANPTIAKETVVSALIAALQRVEETSRAARSQEERENVEAELAKLRREIVLETLSSSKANLEGWKLAQADSSDNAENSLYACFDDRKSKVDSLLSGIDRLAMEIDDLMTEIESVKVSDSLLRASSLDRFGFDAPHFSNLKTETQNLIVDMVCPYMIEGIEEDLPEFSLSVYLGEAEIDADTFLMIEAEPAMPDIRLKVDGNKKSYELRLVIVDTLYKRLNSTSPWILRRADITRYPSDDFQTQNNNEVWDLDFGADFRGGKVYAVAQFREFADTVLFYIRGENPGAVEIRTYTETLPNGDAWYFPKMLRQESSFRQFNNGQPGPNNGEPVGGGEIRSVDNGGRPNWGNPFGWGLKQLDNLGSARYGEFNQVSNRFGPSADELWNWQANLRKGVIFFNDEKMATALTTWGNALARVEEWEDRNPQFAQDNYPMVIDQSLNQNEVGSTLTGNMAIGAEIFSSHHRNLPAGNRSLIEADALKFYNGGRYYSLEIPQMPNPPNVAPPSLPIWHIDKTQPRGGVQADYVQEISSRNGW